MLDDEAWHAAGDVDRLADEGAEGARGQDRGHLGSASGGMAQGRSLQHRPYGRRCDTTIGDAPEKPPRTLSRSSVGWPG